MKRILSIIAALCLLMACGKEDDQPIVTAQKTSGNGPVFYATTETTGNPDTKVYADENLMVLWNENDSISIFNMRTVNDLYVFTGEDGDTGGGFEEIPYSGFVSGNDLDYVYAVYPYSRLGNKINNLGSQITVTLPSEQNFKEHSFGIKANTMVAVTDNNFLGFKNVCGYLKFRFYGDNVKVKSVTLEGNNGEKIAGKAYITPSISSAPTVAMDDAATTSITLNCSEPVTLGTSSTDYTEFIFVVPPTTFEGGFKVTVTDVMGATFEKSSTRSLTITRNKMESMGAMKVTPNYDNIFVEFDDDNFKAYCVENFDTNGDGEISLYEAKMIKKISITTQNISSLKGIEYFNNLTYLNYNGSYNNSTYKLSTLDVSRNALLDTLICDHNQLTSLDVSNNTALTYLNCSLNHLTSLDLSNNTSLIILNCYINQLTSLDVSNNTALMHLDCHQDQLTSLDVSKNTSLKYLDCMYNQLISLDISNCSELVNLYCIGNFLSNLNVSDCSALGNLSCSFNQLNNLDVSNNSNLQALDCSSNQLTNIDVSNNSRLLFLYCSSNQLIYLDLRHNTELSILSAWPQSGTLYRLWKKRGQSISYQNGSLVSIEPSDYGTEILEVE